jgi:hypothetical protein
VPGPKTPGIGSGEPDLGTTVSRTVFRGSKGLVNFLRTICDCKGRAPGKFLISSVGTGRTAFRATAPA